MKKNKWQKTCSNNVVLEADWGRVSYNPNTSSGHPLGIEITDFLNELGQDVNDGEETALYDGDVWRILTGDFRKEYEKVFPDFKKCLAVYNKYKDKYRNNYSTDKIN